MPAVQLFLMMRQYLFNNNKGGIDLYTKEMIDDGTVDQMLNQQNPRAN